MFKPLDREKQLRKRLRAIQFFMVFGFFVILLFWIGEILFERKEQLLAHDGVIIAARIGFYAFILPFLLHYYIYNAINDIKKNSKFLIDIDCVGASCRGTLLSKEVIDIGKSDAKDEVVVIFGKKYLCSVFLQGSKLFYLPVKEVTGLRF